MGVPTWEVGYTTPPPEGRPWSSWEHVVTLGRRKTKLSLYTATLNMQFKYSISIQTLVIKLFLVVSCVTSSTRNWHFYSSVVVTIWKAPADYLICLHNILKGTKKMSLIRFNYSLFWKFAKSCLICKSDVHIFLDPYTFYPNKISHDI
jgi:hypothetical protein